ncbi:MAG: TIGR02757 family protein [Cyanobacteria bacterium RUI128]|nr:TIGR02757 family protein [Cyanobacteria bacterium RUI128]
MGMPVCEFKISKSELDELVTKYETVDFIDSDPVRFPHKYSERQDIEIAGFIASLFAYGNRKLFIAKLNDFFWYAQNEPTAFIKNGEFSILFEKDFNYRFSKPFEIVELMKILSELYNTSGGLMELFEYGYKQCDMFGTVTDYFYSRVDKKAGQGFYHLLPDPRKGGAMKRLNMFMRWMIRKSDVDLGCWNFMPKSELLMPLDVHVARLSREMLLLNRKSNDMKAVIELTDNLKQFDSADPVKYDFAIFGKGVEG